MKIDNFTTARCSKCGWTKQFQPGVEHDVEDFKCDCNKEAPVVEEKPKKSIKKTLAKTLMEASSGTDSNETTKENTEG